MNTKKLFTALLIAVSATAMGQEVQLELDRVYYLYNVGTGKYFAHGNKYGTQASVGDDPLYVKFTRYGDEGNVLLLNSFFLSSWCLSYIANFSEIFIDRYQDSQYNYGWQFTKVGDYYRLQLGPQGSPINPNYYSNGNYVGVDVTSDPTNTKLATRLTATEGHCVDWLLVDPATVEKPRSWAAPNLGNASWWSDRTWHFTTTATSAVCLNYSAVCNSSNKLYFYLDGKNLATFSSNAAGFFCANVPAGDHYFGVAYNRTSNSAFGADIDKVVFGEAADVLTPNISPLEQAIADNEHLDPVLKAEMEAYIAQVRVGDYDKEDPAGVLKQLYEYRMRATYRFVSVHVDNPGLLSDYVLAQVENLSDVESMRITGKFDSNDIYALKNLFPSLKELDIEGVERTSTETSLFANNKVIERVILPTTLKTIGANTFSGCTRLVEVKLPSTLEQIQNNAFDGCTSLREITMPASLTTIGQYAFQNTTSMKKVNLNEGLISIGNYSFYNSRIENLVLPSTLTTIPNYAFRDCDKLRNIHFNGQTSIGDYAFYDCDSLRAVILPETLQSLGRYYAFWGCDAIKTLHLNEGLTTIPPHTFAGNSCDTIIIPSTVKEIQEEAFYSSHCLRHIELNEGLVKLYNGAFKDVDSLRKVTLPSTLQATTGTPFVNCDNLNTVYCRAIVTPYTYDNNIVGRQGIDLYVPQLSTAAYKQRAGWAQFNIKGYDYLPENITVTEEYRLNWPDEVSLTYKPNVRIAGYDIDGNVRNWHYGGLWVFGNSTLSANDFTITYDPNIGWHYRNSVGSNSRKATYGSLINNATIRADHVNIEMYVHPLRWEFVCLPFDVKVSDIVRKYESADFVIRKYDGERRAAGDMNNTWVTMTADSTLHAGQGYIWMSAMPDEADYQGFYITAEQTVSKNRLFTADDVEVPMAYHESEFAHNRSWNLVGNPYPAYYDSRAMTFTAPFITWNSYSNKYVAYSPVDDSYIMNPSEAIFVQRPVDQEAILFKKEGRQLNLEVRDVTYDNAARATARQSERYVFNLTLSGEGQSDGTRFVINSQASTAYEQDKDASKFNSMDAQSLQLYTLQGTLRYAINERPLDNSLIDLGFTAGQDGQYTITLDNNVDGELWLQDHLTATEMRLDGTTGYTFQSEAGTFNTRFTLRIGAGTVTGISAARNDKGEMINDNCFDLQGRRMERSIFNVQRSMLKKGIYIKNGQKIVK